MERIALKPAPESYEITAPAYDDDGTTVPVTGTLGISVYDSFDVLVDSGTPTAPAGILAYSLPNSAIAAAGVYRLIWTGTAGGAARTWETYVEFYDDTAPDYETYTDAGGTFDAETFHAMLPAARAAVDAAIWPNTLAVRDFAAYERAVCAVVDLIDSPAVTRESVGRVSLEYADVPTVASTIRRHLTGTGLLYRGI
jgi:hypothetical protein